MGAYYLNLRCVCGETTICTTANQAEINSEQILWYCSKCVQMKNQKIISRQKMTEVKNDNKN